MAMDKPSGRRLLAIAILVLLIGGAITLRVAYFSPYHFAEVQPRVLYRSGNNSLRRLQLAIDAAHVRTVVALIDDQEFADTTKPQFAQEKAWAESQGIRYVRVPVRLGGWPSSEALQQFLHVTADPVNQPVLVHCAQGVRRTGMFVAAFQESQLGWSPQRTKSAIEPFGHGQETIQNIMTFIDHYDPKSESLSSSDLGKGAGD